VEESLKALDQDEAEPEPDPDEKSESEEQEDETEEASPTPAKTELPDQSGKVLDPEKNQEREAQSATQKDDWSVPSESTGNVTVNISSGEKEDE
jgi:hypothetical protein